MLMAHGSLLGAALTSAHDSNSFQNFGWCAGSLWQKSVCPIGSFERLNGRTDQDCRNFRRKLLHPPNQFIAVHIRQEQVTQNQINPAIAEKLHRPLTGQRGHHTISPSFKHEFADRQRLIVVIYAQNCLFRPHRFPYFSPRKRHSQAAAHRCALYGSDGLTASWPVTRPKTEMRGSPRAAEQRIDRAAVHQRGTAIRARARTRRTSTPCTVACA